MGTGKLGRSAFSPRQMSDVRASRLPEPLKPVPIRLAGRTRPWTLTRTKMDRLLLQRREARTSFVTRYRVEDL
uniref:hypothetical protein n=1 Tax=Hassallia byssoidea TaxID=482630 RepID=UPI001F48701E